MRGTSPLALHCTPSRLLNRYLRGPCSHQQLTAITCDLLGPNLCISCGCCFACCCTAELKLQMLLASVKAHSTKHYTSALSLPHALCGPCRLPETALQVLSNMTWVCATAGFHHDTAFIQAAAAAVTDCAGSLRGQVVVLLHPACICLCTPLHTTYDLKVSTRQTDTACVTLGH